MRFTTNYALDARTRPHNGATRVRGEGAGPLALAFALVPVSQFFIVRVLFNCFLLCILHEWIILFCNVVEKLVFSHLLDSTHISIPHHRKIVAVRGATDGTDSATAAVREFALLGSSRAFAYIE